MHQGKVTGDAEIGADSVDSEVVRIGALTVDAELPLVVESRGGHHHAWRQQDQRLETPAIKWKTFDEGAVNHRADRCRLGVDERSASFDRDAVRRGAKRHREVDFESILHVQDHIRLD